MSMNQCCFCCGEYIKENGEIDMIKYYDLILDGVNHIIERAKKEKPKGTKTWGIPEITFNPDKICRHPRHIVGNYFKYS